MLKGKPRQESYQPPPSRVVEIGRLREEAARHLVTTLTLLHRSNRERIPPIHELPPKFSGDLLREDWYTHPLIPWKKPEEFPLPAYSLGIASLYSAWYTSPIPWPQGPKLRGVAKERGLLSAVRELFVKRGQKDPLKLFLENGGYFLSLHIRRQTKHVKTRAAILSLGPRENGVPVVNIWEKDVTDKLESGILQEGAEIFLLYGGHTTTSRTPAPTPILQILKTARGETATFLGGGPFCRHPQNENLVW